MEYKRTIKEMYSDICGENVYIMEYESKNNFPYCECTRCGKDIRKRMYVIQSVETDIELMYLGTECYKKFT